MTDEHEPDFLTRRRFLCALAASVVAAGATLPVGMRGAIGRPSPWAMTVGGPAGEPSWTAVKFYVWQDGEWIVMRRHDSGDVVWQFRLPKFSDADIRSAT